MGSIRKETSFNSASGPANQRMHQPGRGPAVGAGGHGLPWLGRFPEARRAPQVMRGP
jgi:hypothetical protein